MKNKTVAIKKRLFKEIAQLRDERGFIRAGLPRYNRLFGRDSLIVSWQLLNIDSKICQKTLEILAKLQGKKTNKDNEEEPGKILHETGLKKKFNPEIPNLLFPYYGSVDSTLWFLILFSFYFRKTKDRKFLKKYWPNVLSSLNWLINYGDKDNDLFLEYKRENPKGLFHQGWKDSLKNHLKISPPVAIVEVQGYQYLALKKIAKLSRTLSDRKLEKALILRAENLKKRFNERFWMKKEKYFALALDKNKKQKKTITSNPGHLLFTGIVETRKVAGVAKRLFQKDLWTPYGIRTLSTKESDFDHYSSHLGSVWPHDNWIIAQGMKKLGYKTEYLKIKKALLRVYKKLGFLPEFYGIVNNDIILEMEKPICYPQAWASGALLNFLS